MFRGRGWSEPMNLFWWIPPVAYFGIRSTLARIDIQWSHHFTIKFSNANDHSINPGIAAIWMRRTCDSKLLQLGSSPGCTWLKLALVSSGAHARPFQVSQSCKDCESNWNVKKKWETWFLSSLRLNWNSTHKHGIVGIIVFALFASALFCPKPKALLKVPAGHVGGFALAFAHTFLHEHWLPNVQAFAHAFPHSLAWHNQATRVQQRVGSRSLDNKWHLRLSRAAFHSFAPTPAVPHASAHLMLAQIHKRIKTIKALFMEEILQQLTGRTSCFW